MLKFTRDHEWVRFEGEEAVVGITAYAANALGDVVFVELPSLGQIVAKGQGFAVVESVKAASDVYAPIDGEVTAINSALSQSPETLNSDPMNAGWFAKIKPSSDLGSDLMDQAAYDAYLTTL
jgi:glycine cleavage system H protein